MSAADHLGPQFHQRGDGAFSPGHQFDQFEEFHTAPNIEMPYRTDINKLGRAPAHTKDFAELRRVAPRLAGRAMFVSEDDHLKIVKDEQRMSATKCIEKQTWALVFYDSGNLGVTQLASEFIQ